MSCLGYFFSGNCVQLVYLLLFFFSFVGVNFILVANVFSLFLRLTFLDYISGCFVEPLNCGICFLFCFKAYHPTFPILPLMSWVTFIHLIFPRPSNIYFQGTLLSLHLFYCFFVFLFFLLQILSFLILSIPFLISLSSFFLSFSSCSFCFNIISCAFIVILLIDCLLPIFSQCPFFCSCIFKSLICWFLSDTWFVLILSQFSNVITIACNVFFSRLIFVILFSFCCCFC